MQELESLKKHVAELQEDIKRYEMGFAYKPPKYLYHAISGPMDEYTWYRPLFMMGYDLYKAEMEENPSNRVDAYKIMGEFTELLYAIMGNFRTICKEVRGEPIYYRTFNLGTVNPVLLFKENNNGTMHAFSFSEEALVNLLHDFGDTWVIEGKVEVK